MESHMRNKMFGGGVAEAAEAAKEAWWRRSEVARKRADNWNMADAVPGTI
jgi:hypothetical protein